MESTQHAAAISPAPAEAAWSRDAILELYALPFNDLLQRAHETHRQHWDANALQLSTLMSIKTGGCAEDCKYCGQSASYTTKLQVEKLSPVEEVAQAAQAAKDAGASRFCMGAAWRELKDRDVPKVAELVRRVKSLGLETCMTLGMLKQEQADTLRDAGLDYYNHNIDTSEEYYPEVISTRDYADRLDTLDKARGSGLKLCSGGIIGMGESRDDRAGMLETLANMAPPPESVPINMLVPVAGTPLADTPPLEPLELVRTIAVARVLMPQSHLRLSAGREALSDEAQALCFFAGANSVFYGDRLLTTDNQEASDDRKLFASLGLHTESISAN